MSIKTHVYITAVRFPQFDKEGKWAKFVGGIYPFYGNAYTGFYIELGNFKRLNLCHFDYKLLD